ncbi:MAG: DUF3667 domain-containing protein [Parabacteroides sp.]|nr:DUF3667 domain-containing protein [Parabacteroides sp.]
METKALFLRIEKRKKRLLRQIEYRRLRRVRRKRTPQYTYCKNCGTKLDGMYCYQCGQYALDIEQPFWKYILQYFENVYQFDGKVWLTLYYLFRRPGFLTCEFNAGKINSYVHPLRLFMFLSCLFFLFFFSLIPTNPSEIGLSMTDNGTDSSKVSVNDVMINVQFSEDMLDYWYDDLSEEERKAAASVDTVIFFCGDSVARKELGYIGKLNPSAEADSIVLFTVPKVLLEEGFLKPLPEDSSMFALADDKNYFDTEPKEVDKEIRKIENELNFGALVSWYSSYFPIILLLLIPVFAFLLKIFFRKEKMAYMKHYAFALHLHSVLLLLIAINLLWVYYIKTPYNKEVTLVLINLFMLYTWLAIRRVYERTGWIKSFIKTGFLYVIYMIILFATIIGTFVWCAVNLFDVDFSKYM